MVNNVPDIILYNGKITTLDPKKPEVTALALKDGLIVAAGSDEQVQALAHATTQTINLGNRRVIPGLNDSHIHVIRGGLNYALELRFDGVPSLEIALRMVKEQVARTPAGQWVRVVGGWSEYQFAEKRMPTLEEINALSETTPIFILHLYDRAWLNKAALKAVGYTKDTPDPVGGHIERDAQGNPTGLIIAQPNALILYATLAKGPKLSPVDQQHSTRAFMKELNRFGLTSGIDAGGGFQNYPEDYQVIEALHNNNQLTLRIAYNLFTQKPLHEFDDFKRWIEMTKPYTGDSMYRQNGAGEMLVFSAADFEDFLYERPDMAYSMEADLKKVVRLLVEHRWPFRMHATYDETIGRALTVFEQVNAEIPLNGLRWFFDHVETVSEANLKRIKSLGGAIAIQDRMAFQGEHFIERYGKDVARTTPPIRSIIDLGIPVGAGTDATRVSSYNPWLSLYWLVTGNTVGGMQLYGQDNRLDRMQALRLYTQGSAYLSREEQSKGSLSVGMYADLAVLSDDYVSVAQEAIKDIESVLTILNGKVVYAAKEFEYLDSNNDLPPLPAWSPVNYFGGYYSKKNTQR